MITAEIRSMGESLRQPFVGILNAKYPNPKPAMNQISCRKRMAKDEPEFA
jgi:hypothetical protein